MAGTPTPTNIQPTTLNPDEIQKNESYVAYGRRMCGKVNGTPTPLTTLLHKVFLYERNRQSNDRQLQERHRLDNQNQLANLQADIERNKIDQRAVEAKLTENDANHQILQNKLIEAQSHIGQENKMAKAKMILGLCILAVLTVYLFVFYSSTFYSAFFKDFMNISDNFLAEAMFDSRAIPLALENGFGSFLFIMCAPMIFMGLGYLLHFYSVDKGKLKYLKIGVTVIITFVFDCILAYIIANKIYDVMVMMSPVDMPPFGFDIAVKDINVWAVIFCGFITYMIWGFVFGLTISAYEELKTNKGEILKYQSEIKQNRAEKTILTDQLTQLQRDESSLGARKQNLDNQLATGVFIFNNDEIRTAMNDFFSGWITVMTPMGLAHEQQQECEAIFNRTTNQLLKD